jgi:hypothetical protein
MTLRARCGSSAASDLYAGDRFSYEIPIAQALSSSRFFMAICPLIGCDRMFSKSESCRTGAMLFDSNQGEHLRELQEQIDRARTMTAQLMAQVIARACARLQAQQQSARARIIRLVQSGASADATLALLELELPQWKLRRLIYDHGEWHCSLSKHIALPAELDDMAEANHESLPLAILSAFVEARRHSVTAGESRPQSVPQVRPMQGYAICCDNFA